MSVEPSSMHATDAAPLTADAGGRSLVVRDSSLSTAVDFPQSLPAPAPAPADGGEIGIDYVRLTHALRRRWAPATLLGLLLSLAFAIPLFVFYPRTYEAMAWLRVRDKGGMLSHGRDPHELEAYKKTNLSLMKSSSVVQAALRRPGIESLATLREAGADQIGWIAKKLQILAPSDSEIVQVKLRGKNPEDVAKIVNAVLDSFLEDVVNKDRTERLSRRDALEKKFKENQAELRSRRDTLSSLARQLGTRDSQEVATQRGLLMEHLHSLRYDLTVSSREIAAIDAELEMAEAREKGEIEVDEVISEETLEAALFRDPQIRELQDRLLDLEETIAYQEQRSVRRSGEPAVRRLKAQAEDLARNLERKKRALKPAILTELLIAQQGRSEAPAVLKKRRDLLAQKLELESKEFDSVSKEVTELGKANADLDNRRSEVEHLQRVTDTIGMELESSAIDLNMPNRVTLIERASVPQSTDIVFLLLITMVAGGGGFALGGGLIVLLEYLRNLVYTSDDIPRRAGLRVLGAFPLLSKLRRRSDYGAITAECGDTIRTVIMQSGRDAPRVMMVTSAVEHEGKTTFATQLAASLARAGHRTLIVDGDLRHPHAHLALDLELRSGFPELLRRELSADEVVQPTSVDGLFAVTGGNCDYAAISALSRHEAGEIIARFRDSFDYVVIDAGPVLAFADSLMLGQRCDGVILTTMIDVSSITLVNKAVERLQSVGVRLMGAVVNGGSANSQSSRYSTALPA
jgi:succinoglycan biosynthesis transport protein ExoP